MLIRHFPNNNTQSASNILAINGVPGITWVKILVGLTISNFHRQ